MLLRSFSFLPGIGPKREAQLWAHGLRSWSDYREAPRLRGIPARLKLSHDDVLELALRALSREDSGFFARTLPFGDHWRAFGEFGDGAAYLDIETTGGVASPGRRGNPSRSDPHGVTVVGVHHRGRTELLVRGVDLSPEAVSRVLGGARMLVTFNGAGFDVPTLSRAGFPVPEVPHLDLRPALRKLGLRGGLKAIERAVGLAREDEVAGLSGWDAVTLWHAYELGDERSLDRLLRYNRADVENMIPLAKLAYEGLSRATFERALEGRPVRRRHVERPLHAYAVM